MLYVALQSPEINWNIVALHYSLITSNISYYMNIIVVQRITVDTCDPKIRGKTFHYDPNQKFVDPLHH